VIGRRRFVILIGGAVMGAANPSLGQPKPAARVGVLVLGYPDPAPFLRTLRAELAALGYAEGRNLVLDIRSAAGQVSGLRAEAEGLVRARVDVIVAFQTPAAHAAKDATAQIPIVMASVGDPLATHLISNLARPGGNITGFSGQSVEIAGKTMSLIQELLPDARRIALLGNAADPFTKPYEAQNEAAAKVLGLGFVPVIITPATPLEQAFATIEREKADALIIQSSIFREEAAGLALKYRLPTASNTTFAARKGVLMSYSANQTEMFRSVADYVDRILKGASPATLPVQQPRKFDLTLNLKTARALGLTVPPYLLARADEVIDQ